jgi:DNA-binding response OmpR family regulator
MGSVLYKPFTPAQLLASVRAAIEESVHEIRTPS